MVLLTMTASIVEALEKIQSFGNLEKDKALAGEEIDDIPSGDHDTRTSQDSHLETDGTMEGNSRISTPSMRLAEGKKTANSGNNGEPKLSSPAVGNPISHGQIIDLSQDMQSKGLKPGRLEDLLKGVRAYVPPPPPKPEPTSEYKSLMARLRREEEARTYERMTNPPPPMESFTQRFPASSAARAFSSHQIPNNPDTDDDDVTYKDVDRQMALIFNVLISIVCCAAAIWIAAKWWSTPMRLALSMSGSALVGVAEVVVYSGYIRRVGEAKGKEKQIKEVKEIINTWTVGAGTASEDKRAGDPVLIESKEDDEGLKARQRKKDIS